jgi:hypothetical protein
VRRDRAVDLGLRQLAERDVRHQGRLRDLAGLVDDVAERAGEVVRHATEGQVREELAGGLRALRQEGREVVGGDPGADERVAEPVAVLGALSELIDELLQVAPDAAGALRAQRSEVGRELAGGVVEQLHGGSVVAHRRLDQRDGSDPTPTATASGPSVASSPLNANVSPSVATVAATLLP